MYVINAPNGKQIQLNVESFEMEESNGCSFDSLEIRFDRILYFVKLNNSLVFNNKYATTILEMEHLINLH